MPRIRIFGFIAVALALAGPLSAAELLPLERIMADPAWIGAPVENSYWALDGRSVFYRAKRDSSDIKDLHRVTLSDGADHVVAAAEYAGIDVDGAAYDRGRTRAAFIRNGDVFVRILVSGPLQQITRSGEAESGLQFSSDDRAVQYRRGTDWFSHDLATGLDAPLQRVLAGKDPNDKKPTDTEQMQLRLFDALREDRARREAARLHTREQVRADSTRVPDAIYLGEDVEIVSTALSPSARWMLVTTTPKGAEAGRVPKMPKYVTESGYEETEDVRPHVGRNTPTPQTLWRVDLESRTVLRLAWNALPGIHDDPLAAVRAENEAAARARAEAVAPAAPAGIAAKPAATAKPAARAIRVINTIFSRDGAQAAVVLRAIDEKDRWIVTVERVAAKPALQHRLSDPAWINWSFNELGWMQDDRTLWFLSEESGYSHLYRKALDGKSVVLTSGAFEMSDPLLSPDGKWLYARGNVQAPYAYDVYRVPVSGGALERVTQLDAVVKFKLSPDGAWVLLEHSRPYVPMQLSVAPATAGGAARSLTDTRKPAYRAMTWNTPQIVPVPSSQAKTLIWSRLYAPADGNGKALRPIVIFVHGSGYLQNTTLGYPYYFREQMFHNRLVQRGYLVLDMDYRASAGYGRDWRTAIYRQMGTPELQDLKDGVAWLVKEQRGDPSRVGIYGGSYGGFMTLMALFRAPEVFRAGAALRPVTDWTTYNHWYTSPILNTPQVDDIAYRRSSPIEYAAGLRGSLLICHGMLDDNVLFQDSVRLLQRLIELHKDDVELAPYPLERHAFTHADSWLDEFKRIDRLFESRLR